MDEYNVKVDTQTLISVSNEVLSSVANLQNAFEQISQVVSRTKSYWEAAGQVKMAEYYNIREDNYASIFNAIKEHIKNLQVIAGVYTETESKNVSAAQMLPDDVIS